MRKYAAWAMLTLCGAAVAFTLPDDSHTTLRSRVQLFHRTDQWKEVTVDYRFNPARSALIVCDVG